MGARLEELEALYRTRRAAFERVAAAVAGDEGLGADAVHDGFVRAVRHRRRFRGAGSLEAWVWRVVVNEAKKRRADSARQLPTDPAELNAAVSSNGVGPAHRARALVAALPERQRLTLFLRYYADLDYAAIAAALDVKPGTVAATLHAAHETLRTQLQEASHE